MTKSVLVVDDEHDIRDLISYNLKKEGFEALTAQDGAQALAILAERPVSLVILDIMMPGLDGYEVCKRIRANQKTATMPVIFLTARSGEVDQIVGLELGADDYIEKPVSPRVLIARVKSVLRRTDKSVKETEPHERIVVEDLEVDRSTYKAMLAGKEVFFPRMEFELLYFFLNHPNRIYSRGDLLNSVWGEETYVGERTVDVHVFKLREKLGSLGGRIETVKGVGYRFRS